MNVFEAVKQSVTTRQAASYYGIRVGRNGMACCPFHNDRTPSMKVDSRYYCFGCGASGDVIDFAASLHGLGKRDAAVRLAEDFSIPYDGAIRIPAAKRTPPKPTPEQRLRQAEQHYFKVLCDYLHLLERWKIESEKCFQILNRTPFVRQAVRLLDEWGVLFEYVEEAV